MDAVDRVEAVVDGADASNIFMKRSGNSVAILTQSARLCPSQAKLTAAPLTSEPMRSNRNVRPGARTNGVVISPTFVAVASTRLRSRSPTVIPVQNGNHYSSSGM